MALVSVSLAGCVYLGYASIVVRRFVRRRDEGSGSVGPVTMMKPLCGEDPGLYENLRSFCLLNCADAQIVFGVRDADDPAVPIVRRLREEFPNVDMTLVIDDRHLGSNFKVTNLQNMLPAAKHDVLVISDSDMRVASDYLSAVTAVLGRPGVGLVTCLYRGVSGGGLWSELSCLHINIGFLPQAVVGDALDRGDCCFGATMALRRSTLEAIGGFGVLADVLADDHVLGEAVRKRNEKVVLSHCIVDDVVVERTLAGLFRHELRWARTIRQVAPIGFVGTIVTQPVVVAAFAVALGSLRVIPLAMLVVAAATRGLTAFSIYQSLEIPPKKLWLLPFRDLLSFVVFVTSFFSRSVKWRNHKFRVNRGGSLMLNGSKRT